MEPKPPSENDRATDDDSFNNVVRLPTEWLGRRRELVPFGPGADSRARQQALNEEADRDVEDVAPIAASAFWGEESAALHHACEPSPRATTEAGSDAPPCADSPTATGTRRRDAAGWHGRVSLRPRRLRGESSRFHLAPPAGSLRMRGRHQPWRLALAVAVPGILLLATLAFLATPRTNRHHAPASLLESGLPHSPLRDHPLRTPSQRAQTTAETRARRQSVNRARERAMSTPARDHAGIRHSSARRPRTPRRPSAPTNAAASAAAGASQSADTSAAQPPAATPVSTSPPPTSGSGYQPTSSGSTANHTTTPAQTTPTSSGHAHPSKSTLRSLIEGAGTCNC